jgi:hypothetical protein
MGTKENVANEKIELDQVDDQHEEVENTSTETHEKVGHLSEEDWIASGRDPKDWKPKEVWKERGQLLKEQARMKRQHEEELENVKKYFKASTLVMAQRIEELESRRDEAIEMGDKDVVKKIDRQIRELENAAPQAPVQPQKNAEITQWEDQNSWIYDDSDPRTSIAKITYANAISSGYTPKQALREIEDVIKQKFPTNTRSQKQIAEQPAGRSSSSSSGKIATMATLSKEEQSIWESGAFSDEKSFLKAVSKVRGEK